MGVRHFPVPMVLVEMTSEMGLLFCKAFSLPLQIEVLVHKPMFAIEVCYIVVQAVVSPAIEALSSVLYCQRAMGLRGSLAMMVVLGRWRFEIMKFRPPALDVVCTPGLSIALPHRSLSL